ncbi:MAG: hypothetical protein F6K47_23850 [Symploca sp. SIO2E6]|nr:hypothetical protein [Symploca sp. SIO2E6]
MTEPKQYNLRIKKSVRKQLLKLQPKFFKQVMSKIISLTDNPRPVVGVTACIIVELITLVTA